MEKCLETGKICTHSNKLCKNCKLDECKETINMIDKLANKEYKEKINKIKAQLPNHCKECNLLKIIDLDKQKVYCPYRLNNNCLLGKEESEFEKNNIISQ